MSLFGLAIQIGKLEKRPDKDVHYHNITRIIRNTEHTISLSRLPPKKLNKLQRYMNSIPKLKKETLD